MEQPKPDFLYILRTLSKYEVEYIIVGGVCAVLHGTPISTFVGVRSGHRLQIRPGT